MKWGVRNKTAKKKKKKGLKMAIFKLLVLSYNIFFILSFEEYEQVEFYVV